MDIGKIQYVLIKGVPLIDNIRCQMCNGCAIKVEDKWYVCAECNFRNYVSDK